MASLILKNEVGKWIDQLKEEKVHPLSKRKEPADWARIVDGAILKPNQSAAEINEFCDMAREFSLFGVCIYGSWLRQVVGRLSGSQTSPIGVVGFPSGLPETTLKGEETRKLIDSGAVEIDMVAHLGYLKSKEEELYLQDIKTVVKAAKGHPVKVIIETCYLTLEEKIKAVLLVAKSGAQFVKTSTGFGTHGATLEDVWILRQVSEGQLKIKASGGIRTLEEIKAYYFMGADRVGTSNLSIFVP